MSGHARHYKACELPHSMTPGATLAATSWLRGGPQPKPDEKRHAYRDNPEQSR